MGPLADLNPHLHAFLERVAHSRDAYRLTARNFLLDEGVSPERARSYQKHAGKLDPPGPESLAPAA